mmetsp:Transcript_7986/g.12787  ORF Transcript_7986/g.12787 Transcript_7986/m.12787 type:complete len:86 (+) Transcript_7986:1218-1475(+)
MPPLTPIMDASQGQNLYSFLCIVTPIIIKTKQKKKSKKKKKKKKKEIKQQIKMEAQSYIRARKEEEEEDGLHSTGLLGGYLSAKP